MNVDQLAFRLCRELGIPHWFESEAWQAELTDIGLAVTWIAAGSFYFFAYNAFTMEHIIAANGLPLITRITGSG